MIIAISIVDKHKVGKAPGSGHVGTYLVDIPEVDAGASHYDVQAVQCWHDSEEAVRKQYPFGRLMDKSAMASLGEVSDAEGKTVQ